MSQFGHELFSTISNNGYIKEGSEEFRNHCCLISIKNYIERMPQNDPITLVELRRIGNATDQTWPKTKEFNYENKSQCKILETIALNFNLVINFIYVNKTVDRPHPWLGNVAYTINPYGNNIVNIAAFGNHFELIVSDRTIGSSLYQPKKIDTKTLKYIPVSIEDTLYMYNNKMDDITNYYVEAMKGTTNRIETLNKEYNTFFDQLKPLHENYIKSIQCKCKKHRALYEEKYNKEKFVIQNMIDQKKEQMGKLNQTLYNIKQEYDQYLKSLKHKSENDDADLAKQMQFDEYNNLKKKYYILQKKYHILQRKLF
jgi:hypothetical protein